MPSGAPPLYTVVPFVLLLLSIAVFPLWAPRWWEHNRHKLLLSCALGVPVFLLYVVRAPAALLDTGEEYASFVILLAALYTIAGGVRLSGDLVARPFTNTTFLATGAVLSSIVGTTGASMLLVRALLQTNRERVHVKHTVVFFIFIVSNIGGLLTPLGDPPLFLGYLQGVPFTWTLRLTPHWLLMNGVLLALYAGWDAAMYAREPRAAILRDRARTEPLAVRGTLNVIWLGGVVVAVAFLTAPAREIAMIVLAAVSLASTPRAIRAANGVTATPIIEVAVLFFGIFLTMMPALELLRLRGSELGVRAPWQFFWATGVLSSFLDNAPTYRALLALGQGLGLPADVVGVPHAILTAISMGAVAMGANTYIGNAPNFMVKAIAEEAGVKMPNFFGFMTYSAAVLLPLFALVTYVFF